MGAIDFCQNSFQRTFCILTFERAATLSEMFTLLFRLRGWGRGVKCGLCMRDLPLEKWWGEGKKQKKQNSWKGGWLKKKNCKEEVKKTKITAKWIALSSLQTVVTWKAPWQPLYTAVLISWSSDGIPIHLVFSTIRKTDIFPFQDWYIMCAATSSWTLRAKHPCRKTLTANHGLKAIKKKKCVLNSHPAWFVCN